MTTKNERKVLLNGSAKKTPRGLFCLIESEAV
ncbi:MAG: hypothetical protein ACD_56C00036G0004 [uncultured bacterium]|nr:MAG: hypothetical protein ACD_56C00036G0004 [uncultured bacterium]